MALPPTPKDSTPPPPLPRPAHSETPTAVMLGYLRLFPFCFPLIPFDFTCRGQKQRGINKVSRNQAEQGHAVLAVGVLLEIYKQKKQQKTEKSNSEIQLEQPLTVFIMFDWKVKIPLKFFWSGGSTWWWRCCLLVIRRPAAHFAPQNLSKLFHPLFVESSDNCFRKRLLNIWKKATKKSVVFGLMQILTNEKTGKQLECLIMPCRRHVASCKIAVYLFHRKQMRRRDESTAGGRATQDWKSYFPPQYVYIFSSTGCSFKLPWWLACGMIGLNSPESFVHLITQESLDKGFCCFFFPGNHLFFLLFLSAFPALFCSRHTCGTDQSCDVWQWGDAFSWYMLQHPSI